METVRDLLEEIGFYSVPVVFGALGVWLIVEICRWGFR
jgi:hypothetical protein